MLRAQVQFLVRELRFAQAAWGKKKSEFLLAAKKKKKKKKAREGAACGRAGAVFLGVRDGLLLDPHNGFLVFPSLCSVVFPF